MRRRRFVGAERLECKSVDRLIQSFLIRRFMYELRTTTEVGCVKPSASAVQSSVCIISVIPVAFIKKAKRNQEL